MRRDPLQPVLGGDVPFDSTAMEIESRAEFDVHLAKGSLAGLVVLGLRLDENPPDLASVNVGETLFVGCRLASDAVEIDLIRRGAHLVPPFDNLPYPTHPATLYTPEDLAEGFQQGGFAGMYDTRVYHHFLAHGGATPDIREALAQRLHDAGIDNALRKALAEWVAESGAQNPTAQSATQNPTAQNAAPTRAAGHGATRIPGRGPVGIMGGHAEPRGSAHYRMAATMAWRLAGAGRLIVTGGGPGMMEAANLGAYLAGRPAEDLAAAIDLLAPAPDYLDHDRYTAAAIRVRKTFPAVHGRPSGTDPGTPAAQNLAGPGTVAADNLASPDPGTVAAQDLVDKLTHGGLALPTWLYGHEPANLFAGQIGKYFSNAVREDSILRLSRGGIVFAPGWAGTVQEIFQAATKTFYQTDGPSGAFVFLGVEHWANLPVEALLRPLLAKSPHGDQSNLIMVTDSMDEAMEALTGG